MKRQGLIVGKFYPPHRGHKLLIDTALAQVDQLTVVVCQKPGEDPAGELRQAWLREIHPGVEVLLIDDQYDENDSRVWAENCIRWLGRAPDVVFASEDYLGPFARHLGCEAIMVDRERVAVPISARQIRANPLRCWHYLEPPVRAHFVKRVCIVGAESTGKTTLAQALAEHYRTEWVPEYGREISERKMAERGSYEFVTEDFEVIARTQRRMEEEAARRANRVLICDTDAFATYIWHRRYMGFDSRAVKAIADDHKRPDLYLLTDIATPFVQDGFRDGESIREWMHEAFVEALTERGVPFYPITGTHEERMAAAIELVDGLR